MFQFERLCFCTTSDNFEKLNFGKDMPILHLYEIIKSSRRPMGDDEITEGPFILTLIKNDNNGRFSTIYELQDESFDKRRPRSKFDWRILPPGFDKEALEASNTWIHRFYFNNSFPDDTDIPGNSFYYYEQMYAGLDEDITPDRKKDAIHFGNGGVGHWGVNLCCRIKKI